MNQNLLTLSIVVAKGLVTGGSARREPPGHTREGPSAHRCVVAGKPLMDSGQGHLTVDRSGIGRCNVVLKQWPKALNRGDIRRRTRPVSLSPIAQRGVIGKPGQVVLTEVASVRRGAVLLKGPTGAIIVCIKECLYAGQEGREVGSCVSLSIDGATLSHNDGTDEAPLGNSSVDVNDKCRPVLLLERPGMLASSTILLFVVGVGAVL